MNTNRNCGCKGWNSCLICEEKFNINPKNIKENLIKESHESYVYCSQCNKAWPGWDMNSYKLHPLHQGSSIDIPGVYLHNDFISDKEEDHLLKEIDKITWDLSQSGRRKQNFGPQCNFKRKVVQLGKFNGFPLFTKFVQDRFESISLLKNYQTIEQCALEYDPKRGAAIDPHIDDCWIWGERIVTLSLLSDSVLTLNYCNNRDKYNLDCVKTLTPLENNLYPNVIIRIPMPRRSLLVLFENARYKWEHCILREDINERRVCLTYREFSEPYLSDGLFENEGLQIIERASFF